MIKGQEISELLVICDNTPGRLSVWMIIIMLFMIRLVFLAAYYNLEKYRAARLCLLKKKMESALAGCYREQTSFMQNYETQKVLDKADRNQQDEEDAEVMELFNSLKGKKGKQP